MPIISMPGTPIQRANWLDWARWRREGKRIMYVKNSNEPVWVDRDKIVYKLSEIPDHHLCNIERWLLGRGAEDVPIRKRAYDNGWYTIVRDEMERRGLELKDDHKDAFDEKVTLRTGNQDAAYQSRMREIILAERLLYREAVDMGLESYLMSEFTDAGIAEPHQLVMEKPIHGEPGWDGTEDIDEGRPW